MNVVHVKQENDEEENDTSDSYCMNQTASPLSEADVTEDSNGEIKSNNDTLDCTGALIDILLQDVKQEPQTEKSYSADKEPPLSPVDLSCVNKRKEVNESFSMIDDNICPVCNKTFDTFGNLCTHVQTEHVEEDVLSPTNDAERLEDDEMEGEGLDCSGSADVDQNGTASVREKIYLCVECQNSFTTKEYLKRHKIRVHGEKKYTCDICDYGTTYTYRLKLHLESVHLKNKPHRCTQCDYECYFISSLTKHIRAVHEQLKPFECPLCDKKFTTSSNYDRHYRSVHCSERLHSCEQCGHKFAEKNKLLRHKQVVHEGVKAFHCGECGQNYSQKSALQRHMMSVHCAERPFKCTECDKSFTTKYHLNRHCYNVH